MKFEVPKSVIATLENNPHELVECLDQGENVNAKGPYGATALHWAAMLGRETMAELLLEHGAEPSTIDFFGRTPAQVARAYENHRVGVVLAKRRAEKQERQR